MRLSIGVFVALSVVGCTNPEQPENMSGFETEGDSSSTSGPSTSVSTSQASVSDPSTSSTTVDDPTTSSSTDEPNTVTGETDATTEPMSSSSSGEPTSTMSTSEPESSSSESSSDSGGGLVPFDFDDFDDPDTLDDWFIRDIEEGTPAQYTTLDFDDTNAGSMTIIPTTSGWYADYDGPFVYKMVSGDFMIETQVTVTGLADPDGPPTQTYNSGGIMLRDPANVDGGEDWVLHNTGYQEFGVASEAKYTHNSNSFLTTLDGTNAGRLRICRIGGDIAVARYLDGDAGWIDTEEAFPDDLPDEVQAGMAVTAWNSTGNDPAFDEDPDMIAIWHYVAFYEIDDMSQCYED